MFCKKKGVFIIINLKQKSVSKRLNVVIILVIALFLSMVAVGCSSKSSTEETQGNTSQEAQETQETQKESSPTSLSWGASSLGSVFYILSVGMGEIIHENAGINVAVEPVGGSGANMHALIADKIDIGMIGNAGSTDAFRGRGDFAKVGKQPTRILAQGQVSTRILVTRSDSGIKSVEDLKGKAVIAKRRALSDVELSFLAMLKAYGLTENDVKILETAETNEAIEAVELGTADAALIPAAIAASNLTEMAQNTDVTFLSIPDDKMSIVLEEMGPAWKKVTIPAGTYKGQDEEVHIPAVPTGLVVMEDFSEDVAYQITKALLENEERVAALHNEGKEWTLEAALTNPPIPYHPGAIKYFKEINAWTPELEKIQQDLVNSF
ncbi:TAXI family TRAP transporter solute-binding subunit [Bacillus sp. Marseille-P3661]|uniref:TAXI family TRAP transporter solute-binding subunit n=1 Tax=Bacillus sp. Marseille-P3661 TaxID=1936234 RepID=UPI000C81D69E|nr:TAXI family TRAP transporter solute-binding subunit [Bacillus sp. Marseille-P3661]